MRKLKIYCCIIIAVIGIVLMLRATYVPVDLHLHGRYKIDTSGIRELEFIEENTPFTFFIQTKANDLKSYLLNVYCLELPDEVVADINIYDNGRLILSFGREIKEIKHSGFFDEIGTRAEAEVTFYEKYQGDVMFAYWVADDTYFQEQDFYIINGSRRMFWGEGRVGTVYAKELGNV